ncbi:YjgN family protein [Caldimonas tepidiphila]|uniref:YjgN family protein n=1 Tax=Caldimonas tepidiphila TaxID=2315841 RepID=UPI0013008D51|nr:DUF898 family protein [Caldimonas tepidiphila]
MNTTLLTLDAATTGTEAPAADAARPAPPVPPAPARPPSEAASFGRLRDPRDAYRATLQFSGTGGEYFRLWIVNLLLSVVTLGLYRPWAKVRRLRYFYNNTHVAGHGLDFHGRPWQMLRGMLLGGVLLLLYMHATGSASPVAVLGAVAAALVLWPPMLRAALQFRLGHTSWRGLRFGFGGSIAGAYAAVGLPLLLVLQPLVIGAFFDAGAAPGTRRLPPGAGLWLSAVVGASLLALPYLHWRLLHYRHDNFRLGTLRSELRLGVGRMYGLYLRTLGLALLAPLLLAGGAALAGRGAVPAALALAAVAGAYLYLYLVVWSYFKVGLQNLVWSRTGNRYLRLRSELSLPPYLLLQLKNLLLLVATLGLYWPWAAVAQHRMRIEAVTLVSRVDLDDITQILQPGRGDAAAEAAGELLGLDLGV